MQSTYSYFNPNPNPHPNPNSYTSKNVSRTSTYFSPSPKYMADKNATFDLNAYQQQREQEKLLKQMTPEQQAQYAQMCNAQYQAASLMQQQQAALAALPPEQQAAYAANQQQAALQQQQAALASMTPEQQSAYVTQQQAAVAAAQAQPGVTAEQKAQLAQHQVVLAQQQAALARHAAMSPAQKQHMAQQHQHAQQAQHQQAFNSMTPEQQSQYLTQQQVVLQQQQQLAKTPEQKKEIAAHQKQITQQLLALTKQAKEKQQKEQDMLTQQLIRSLASKDEPKEEEKDSGAASGARAADASRRPVVAPAYALQQRQQQQQQGNWGAPGASNAWGGSAPYAHPHAGGKGKGKGGTLHEQFANFKGKKVFVGGLHGALTREELWNYFGQFGNLKEAVIAVDRNGQSKYFGFVSYFRNEDVKKLGTRDHYINGRWIDVKPYDDGDDKGKGKGADNTKRSRSRQRSRSRSRGRQRSRSCGRDWRRRSRSRSRSPRGRRTPSPLRNRRGGSNGRRRSNDRSPRPSRPRSAGSRKSKKSTTSRREDGSRSPRSGRRAKSSGSARSNRSDKSRGSRRSRRSRDYSRSRSRSKSRSRTKSAERRTNRRAEYRQSQREALDAIVDLPVTIEVEGGGKQIEPLKSWEDAVTRKIMPQQLMEILLKEGLNAPTLVQRYCVAMAYNRDRDLICSAQTGSGKTFAFVIPTVCALINQGEIFRPWFPGQLTQASPLVLVLSPTRELAIQTDREVQSLFQHTHLRSMCVYGGEPLPTQLARMDNKQIDFLSGTPGRVMDMIDQARLSLNYVQTLVIDEADQMFDLGLEKVVFDVLFGRDLPAERQTLLFSATFPPRLQDLCKSTLRAPDPERLSTTGHWSIVIGKEPEGSRSGTVEHIAQHVYLAANDIEKELFCIRDVSQLVTPQDKCIIFTNRRKQAEAMMGKLALACAELKINHLHGKLEQWQREEVVSEFDQGVGQVLIASNVASRGLDFPNVKLVIQYDMAEDLTIYTHRIGRTGRLGNTGTAITYFTRKDSQLARPLVGFLKLNKQNIPDWLATMRS